MSRVTRCGGGDEDGVARVTVLVNPTAGGGRAARAAPRAVAHLRRAGLDVTVRQGADGPATADMARQAASERPDALVVVGGDGTVHLAAQALVDTGLPLGVVPAGSGDDVARMLGVPLHDPAAAAEVTVAGVLRGRTRRLDVARVHASCVLTVVATGFDSRVNERANRMAWPRGRRRYTLATLAELGVFRPRPYTIESDGERFETEAVLVAVGNGPSYGGGLRICDGARPDDGRLDLVVIGPMSTAGLVRTYPKLRSGRHTAHPAYSHRLARRVSVAAPGVVGYGDGERLGPLPLTVEVGTGALRVCAA